MVAIAKANGENIMFVTWAYSPFMQDYASTPYYNVGFKENRDTMKKVAAKNNIPLYDLAAVMPTDPKY